MKPAAVWALALFLALITATAWRDARAQDSRPRLFSSVMQNVEARVAAVERTTSQLGAALGDLNDAVAEQTTHAAAQIAELSGDLNTLGAQIAAEREAAAAGDMERLDALARRVEALRGDISAFNAALADAQTQATQSRAQLGALNALVSEQAGLLQSTALTAARLAGVEQAVAALDGRLTELAAQPDPGPDPAVDALRRRLEILDEIVGAQAAGLETVDQAAAQAAALGEAVAALDARINVLASQPPDPTFTAWFERVNQALSDHARRLTAATEAVALVTELVRPNAELNGRVAALGQALSAQTTDLRAGIDALERRVEALAQPDAALEARLAALDAALAAQQSAVSDQQSAIEAIAGVQTDSFMQASGVQDAAAAQAAELAEAVDALERRVEALAQPDAALEARLAALDAALARQAADVAAALDAAAQAAPLLEPAAQAQERLDALRAALEEQNVRTQIAQATQTAALGEAVATLQTQIDAAADPRPEVLTRLDALETTAAQRAETAQTAAAAQDARLTDLRAQAADLTARLEELSRPDTALQARLQALETALARQAEAMRAAAMSHTAALSKVIAVMARPDATITDRLEALEAAARQEVEQAAERGDAASDATDSAPVSAAGAAASEEILARVADLEASLAAAQTALTALANQPAQDWATPESVRLVAAQAEALTQAAAALQQTVDANHEAAQSQGALAQQRIDALTLRADSLNERAASNNDAIENHEGRIEDNALKLYEVITNMERLTENLQNISGGNGRLRDAATGPIEARPPNAHGAAAAALALGLSLFAPLGVLLMGAHFGRGPEAASLAARAALTWSGAVVSFAFMGAGLALGPTLGGWIGNPSAFLTELTTARLQDMAPEQLSALTGQSVLAGLAALVACSAAPNLSGPQRLLISVLIGALAYPAAAHWTRGAIGDGGAGWIAALGYVSPGGATEIAVISGFAALFLRKSFPPRAPEEGQPDGAPPPLAALGALTLWAAWLGASLASLEPLASPVHIAAASGVGAAAACLTAAAFGLLATTDSTWMTRAVVAAIAGGIAGPAASISAPLAHVALTGALAAAFFIALTQARSDADGLSALACAVAAGGAASVLAPAIFGAVGLLTRGTFETLFHQLYGAAALGLIAAAVGFGGGWLLKSLKRRRARAAS